MRSAVLFALILAALFARGLSIRSRQEYERVRLLRFCALYKKFGINDQDIIEKYSAVGGLCTLRGIKLMQADMAFCTGQNIDPSENAFNQLARDCFEEQAFEGECQKLIDRCRQPERNLEAEFGRILFSRGTAEDYRKLAQQSCSAQQTVNDCLEEMIANDQSGACDAKRRRAMSLIIVENRVGWVKQCDNNAESLTLLLQSPCTLRHFDNLRTDCGAALQRITRFGTTLDKSGSRLDDNYCRALKISKDCHIDIAMENNCGQKFIDATKLLWERPVENLCGNAVPDKDKELVEYVRYECRRFRDEGVLPEEVEPSFETLRATGRLCGGSSESRGGEQLAVQGVLNCMRFHIDITDAMDKFIERACPNVADTPKEQRPWNLFRQVREHCKKFRTDGIIPLLAKEQLDNIGICTRAGLITVAQFEGQCQSLGVSINKRIDEKLDEACPN